MKCFICNRTIEGRGHDVLPFVPLGLKKGSPPFLCDECFERVGKSLLKFTHNFVNDFKTKILVLHQDGRTELLNNFDLQKLGKFAKVLESNEEEYVVIHNLKDTRTGCENYNSLAHLLYNLDLEGDIVIIKRLY